MRMGDVACGYCTWGDDAHGDGVHGEMLYGGMLR